MTARKRISIAGISILALAATIPAIPAAQAAGPAARHCVGDSAGTTQCFGTLAEALDSARTQVAQKNARLASASAAQQAQGEVIQGTFFDNRDYGGDSYTVVGAGLCDGSDGVINYQFNFPPEWHNRISSVQPWANCKIWLYPENDLGGDRDGPFKTNTGWVGTMLDDRTASVGFS